MLAKVVLSIDPGAAADLPVRCRRWSGGSTLQLNCLKSQRISCFRPRASRSGPRRMRGLRCNALKIFVAGPERTVIQLSQSAYSRQPANRIRTSAHPWGVHHREKAYSSLLDGACPADRRLRPIDRLARLRKKEAIVVTGTRAQRRRRHPGARHAQGQGGPDPGIYRPPEPRPDRSSTRSTSSRASASRTMTPTARPAARSPSAASTARASA